MSYFPGKIYEGAGLYLDDYFDLVRAAAASVARARVQAAAELLLETIDCEGMIYCCGNGGSAAIANHLACDCLKGARTGASIRPKVHSLSATIELITAIANDIGYEDIFSFQLASLAKPGDLLIAISSSGASPNIVSALRWARESRVRTIAMTGFAGGAAAELADVVLHVDAQNYGVVEDVHQSLMHALAQYIRHRRLTDPGQLGQMKF